MYGGEDGDTYYVDNAGDTVADYSSAAVGPGNRDKVVASISYTIGNGIEDLDLEYFAGAIDGTGNGAANTITGNYSDNTLWGGAGNDTLVDDYGSNDRLDGGGGFDTMQGGAGNDTYVVDNSFEKPLEFAGQGTDTVEASVSYQLGANLENLVLTGSSGLSGTGNFLANSLTGNGGANTLDGSAGADTLRGGLGIDTFRFSAALGSGNVDTIADYDFGGASDRIELDDAVFTALAPSPRGLTGAEFALGSQATLSTQHIIYNQSNGSLFYDQDGAGGTAQVLFAKLTGSPALSAADFFVV